MPSIIVSIEVSEVFATSTPKWSRISGCSFRQPILVIPGVERPVAGNAGVVDVNVDPALLLDDCIHEFGELRAPSYIDMKPDRVAAQSLQFIHGRLDAPLVDIDDDDTCAFPCKPQRD
ncbi:hypothetical protein ASG50_18715 [Rhizobium sp. Leaf386]|nr:hypothetical protein ASG50_18715 [Rhizobium sp. Leaf386]